MGKAHSNACKRLDFFFKGKLTPIMKVICGRHEVPLKEAANAWGWEEYETAWENIIERNENQL